MMDYLYTIRSLKRIGLLYIKHIENKEDDLHKKY